MEIWQIILLAIYIIGVSVAYLKFTSKFDNNKFEQIAFSFFWPILIVWYIIHYFHNKK